MVASCSMGERADKNRYNSLNVLNDTDSRADDKGMESTLGCHRRLSSLPV